MQEANHEEKEEQAGNRGPAGEGAEEGGAHAVPHEGPNLAERFGGLRARLFKTDREEERADAAPSSDQVMHSVVSSTLAPWAALLIAWPVLVLVLSLGLLSYATLLSYSPRGSLQILRLSATGDISRTRPEGPGGWVFRRGRGREGGPWGR